jgi:lysophospholipase L1-like esterase
MDVLRRRSQLIGVGAVVAAIVAGAALPVVLAAAAPASSVTTSGAPVAACSPPTTGTPAPVAEASPPCTPTMSARPHTGLRDLQVITVSGSGFLPNEFYPLIECDAGATVESQCNLDDNGYAETDPTGAFSTQVTVTRLLKTGTSTTDCAERRACEMAAVSIFDDTVVAATPVTFKDVPLPSMAVSPATDLSDGQNVTVSGAHFPAGEEITFSECPAGDNQFFNCDPDTTGEAVVGPTGSFTTDYEVARVITTNSGSVDCAQAPGCVLSTLGGFGDDLVASTTLGFDPAVPPLPPLDLTLDLLPTGQIDTSGGADLSGTISCTATQPVTVSLAATLTEESYSLPADSSLAATETCGEAPASVSLVLPDQDVPFSAGIGRVSVSLSARNGSSVTQQTVSAAITLSVPAHQAPPVFYVALGDSLAAGFASPTGEGYANDLLTYLQGNVPDVELVDLGCSGETTTSMIEGSYPAGSQLAAATAFLASHQGSVVLVTIDNGGNDYINCINIDPPSYSSPCISATNATVTTNLTTIMSLLRAAAGAPVPIVGMNYFDPFLDYWPDGALGQGIAKESVPVVGEVNSTIGAVYTGEGAPVADVAGAFQTTDLSHKVATPEGRVPVAVANTCQWLDFTCAKGEGGFGDDTDAAGSSVIAGAFEKVLPADLSAAARATTKRRR